MRGIFSLAAGAGMWELLFFTSRLDRPSILALSVLWGAAIYRAIRD